MTPSKVAVGLVPEVTKVAIPLGGTPAMAKSTRRRSAGEGSVYKTGSRWRGAISWTEPDGLRRRRVVSGRTQEEARAKLDAIRRELHLGVPVPKGRSLTLAEYLREWIEAERVRVRPSTWLVREQHVRLWLIPALGRIALTRLTSADVERALAAFLKEGRPGSGARARRRVVSPRTVTHIRTTLRIALHDARRQGLVALNAAADARPPRVPPAPITYLRVADVRRLLDATRDDEYGPLYALAVSTGLRQGELLALTWSDVDLAAGTLTVRQALARTAEGGYAVAPPKTARSRRTILLGSLAREALLRQRGRQDSWEAAAGPAWQNVRGLVFTDELGRPLDPGHVTYVFQRALAAASLPRVRFHDLRHTAATLMLAEGVPLAVIAEWLGHSGIAITAAHYAAIVPALYREAAGAVDRAMGGGGR